MKLGDYMKTTKIMATDKNRDQFDGDLLVYCVPEATDKKLICDQAIQEHMTHAYELGDFSGKEGQTILLYPSVYGNDKLSEKDCITTKFSEISAKRVLAVGLGKLDIFSDTNKDKSTNIHNQGEVREIFRKAGGSVAILSAKIKAEKIMICLPDIEGIAREDAAECLAEGILLGDYRFLKYKKEKKDDPAYKGLTEIRFHSDKSSSSIRKAIKLGSLAAQAVCEARDMANEPGNGWRASDFASYAEALAKKHDLCCTILDKSHMKKLGMEGLLAVNQGSSEPPKMVILEYQPKGNDQQTKSSLKKKKDSQKNQSKREHEIILLVGKGITFDSGGICLKQASGMEDMKYDMCGGAAVLAVMQAVAQERPENVGVVAIVPATDNLSGSNAVKPGDVIRHYNGVTSEIVNTDAEGRMVLADALAYGIELFKPDCVIDIATLTGAAIVGLGHHYSAVLGNSDELFNQLREASERACEPLWRLPLGKEYSKQIESKVADIKNTGGKSAGTITAAAYLENFVGETPWAHIDIAGTAWDFTEKSYIPKGPSGTGVRTFLELIRNWKKMKKDL